MTNTVPQFQENKPESGGECQIIVFKETSNRDSLKIKRISGILY